MNVPQGIKFVTAQSKSKLTAGKTFYQGQIKHNIVLNEKETKKAFAQFCGGHEANSTYYVDLLAEFIAQNVAEGNRLDFGGFSVSLKIRNGFKSANAPFDPKVNTINVEMTPGKAIQSATAALRPINTAADEMWRIDSNLQETPFVVYDQLAADGIRRVSTCGRIPALHSAAPDEGVWIEDDEGVRLMTGEINSSKPMLTIATFIGPLCRGRHWLVLQGRDNDSTALIRVRHRITVV